jgi:SAM-dependent methyltransferase
VLHFAAAMPGWTWQPSDADPASLASIAAWRAHEQPANVRPPLALDVMASPWPLDTTFDAIFCANLLHISPWPCCAALMRGAARHLAPHGRLLIYGPFLIDGQPTALSNLAFDADLRARNPQWGVRRLEDVAAQARLAGLVLREQVAMPANNLTLLFERAS